MLIIPAIAIENNKCCEVPKGLEGTEGKYPSKPVEVARMWRGENAKALHVVDIDSAREGKIVNETLLRELTYSVDVPIQYSGGLRTYEDVRKAFDELGVYRVVLSTSAQQDPELLRKLVMEFSPRKIIVALDVKDGKLLTHGRQQQADTEIEQFALWMKELGIQRLIYNDIDAHESKDGPPYEALKKLAANIGMNITVQGGVWNYQQLERLQSLYPRKVDSLILGEPLYINVFPCQQIWRMAEKDLIDQHKFY
ncbi:MAG: 1-(5-phosphoribosyl)-5-((5-phosphoribosylamino)methylideneamino)imidazole-4-carboxamide isomerase [Ectothiorhodospiraceae bacterium]|nr:1-(5-phosphoribosyl)-5-((5-phosphoribosylamino)methylideneamino)imidazole-4-carboxamide isomerase [Ectothiorhodospiraceae bacterium]